MVWVVYYSIDLRIFPSNQLQIKLSYVIQFHEISIKSNANQFAVTKFPNFSTKWNVNEVSGFNLTKFSVKSNEVSLWGAKLRHFRSS